MPNTQIPSGTNRLAPGTNYITQQNQSETAQLEMPGNDCAIYHPQQIECV